jgi:DNA-binding FadR family transcriptional regulator
MSKSRIAERPKGGSALEHAADELRKLSMSKQEGEFLGAEEHLVRLLGVSRPTLRQASAQLIQENVIEIRRGMGGGYFARMPDSMVVSRIAAIYLRWHDARLEEVVQAVEPIRVEIAKLAANSANDDARAQLAEFVTQDEINGPDASYRDFLRSEREFGKILSGMSGNRVLTLFLQILYHFASLLRQGEDVFSGRPQRVVDYRKLRSRMALAILEGDEEIAVVATRRCAALVNSWMRQTT